MAKEIRKIKVQRFTDDELVEECKQEINCGDCQPLTWTTPPKGDRIDPPKDTVAVIVDVSSNRGAIRIYEEAEGTRVGGIGMEEEGKQVIVPWNNSWWIRASGSLRVGYVIEKTERETI